MSEQTYARLVQIVVLVLVVLALVYGDHLSMASADLPSASTVAAPTMLHGCNRCAKAMAA